MNKTGYICSCCGQYHDELPTSYGSPAPYYCLLLEQKEREDRSVINSDLCILDDKYFFIRGNVEIPIVGSDEMFVWDIWVSVSETNFNRIVELWEDPDRQNKLEPMFGWFSTYLPCHPNTIDLKTMIHTREVGLRPVIELEPTEHPLSIEQREGINLTRIRKIAEEICRKNT